jgi:hypothetical protein
MKPRFSSQYVTSHLVTSLVEVNQAIISLVVAIVPAGEFIMTSATLEVGMEKKVLGKFGSGEN